MLGDDKLTILLPTTMNFLGCIFICQATYAIQQTNGHLKVCYSAIFLSTTEKFRLSLAITLSTLNQWINFYENRYEPYTTRQPSTVHFLSPESNNVIGNVSMYQCI
jgi:hypothetical protein